jgi:hypothetical protein
VTVDGHLILSNNVLDLSQKSSITSIESNSFSGVKIISANFSALMTSSSLKTIENWTFLETIEIQYPITSINSKLFSGCISLKTIIINGTSVLSNYFLDFSQNSPITSIDLLTFSGVQIKFAKFSQSFPSFSLSTFENWTFLETIEIQYPITSINSKLFSGCALLKTIIINGTSILSNNVLDLSQNSSIISIDSYSFSGVQIKTANFSRTFTSFYPHAFENFGFLEVIEIQYPIISIPSGIFSGCVALKTIIIHGISILSNNFLDFSQNSSIKLIGSNSFAGVQITSAKFSPSFKSFSSSTFFNCSFLEIIEIQYPIRTISGEMFLGCTSLQTIIINGSSILSNNVLDFSNASSMTLIGSYSFSQTPILSAIIPSSVKFFEGNAFEDCNQLTFLQVDAPLESPLSVSLKGLTSIEKFIYETLSIVTDHVLNLPYISHSIDVIPAKWCSGTNIISATIDLPYDQFGVECFSNCLKLQKIEIKS